MKRNPQHPISIYLFSAHFLLYRTEIYHNSKILLCITIVGKMKNLRLIKRSLFIMKSSPIIPLTIGWYTLLTFIHISINYFTITGSNTFPFILNLKCYI